MDAAVALHTSGGGAAGAALDGEGLAELDAGAGGVAGLELIVAGGFGAILVPEVTTRAVIMIPFGGVNAVEIPRSVRFAPGGSVVALVDLQGGRDMTIIASTGRWVYLDDFGLRKHLDALVHPEGAAEDGEVIAVVDVEHLVGIILVAVDAGFEEGAATQVEGPACEAVESHVVVPVQRETCSLAEFIRSGSNYHPLLTAT